ncbi:MAG: hypothetical protein ACTHKT_03620 [Solirubrobacterales bacterium]
MEPRVLLAHRHRRSGSLRHPALAGARSPHFR